MTAALTSFFLKCKTCGLGWLDIVRWDYCWRQSLENWSYICSSVKS